MSCSKKVPRIVVQHAMVLMSYGVAYDGSFALEVDTTSNDPSYLEALVKSFFWNECVRNKLNHH